MQMKGHNAFCNYKAACNDPAPEDLSRFTSVSDLIVHAEKITMEFDIAEYKQEYTEYVSEQGDNHDI